MCYQTKSHNHMAFITADVLWHNKKSKLNITSDKDRGVCRECAVALKILGQSDERSTFFVG